MKKHVFVALCAAGIALVTGCMSFEDVKAKADAGDGYWAYQTGIMLKKGDGVKPDYKQALVYFEKAAKAGYEPRGFAMIDAAHHKMFGSRWDMASAWEIMNHIDIEQSKLFGDYYELLWNNFWSYVTWPNPNRVRNINTYERLAAEEKGCEEGFAICLSYLKGLQMRGKRAEANALKKRLTAIVQKEPSWSSQRGRNNIPRKLEEFLEKLDRTERETEKQIAEQKRIIKEKKFAEQMRGFEGIKLYKSIRSGLPVKDFLRHMNAWGFANQMDEEGTRYLINPNASENGIKFIAGFQGVIGKYHINKNYLMKQAPPGFLFGVKYTFGGNVSSEALTEKVKKDFPDAKAAPDVKSVNKFTWGRRNVDFDLVTVTKTWESERVRIIMHYCRIEFMGKEKTLPKSQKQDLENEIAEGARWTNDKQRAGRMKAGMPLAFNGKTMIIVDKALERKMYEITEKAIQRDIAEKEAVRKKKEQKELDF